MPYVTDVLVVDRVQAGESWAVGAGRGPVEERPSRVPDLSGIDVRVFRAGSVRPGGQTHLVARLIRENPRARCVPIMDDASAQGD